MMRVGRFKRKPPNDGVQITGGTPEAGMASRLTELCAGNPELYQVLSKLMFLDPKKITIPLETVLSDAQDYESKGNRLRAEVAYRIAGGISLFRGDAEGVRRYFARASEVAADSRAEYKMLVDRSDEAVAVARRYYEMP